MTSKEIRLLWNIARRTDGPAGQRRWAVAQLACIAVVWATLACTVVMFVIPAMDERYATWVGVTYTLLLTASLGFGTNYVAITMLFQPSNPRDRHWLKFVTLGLWTQGLIPRRKAEIGHSIGDLVHEKLFPPERIAEAIVALLDNFLASPDARGTVTRDVERFVRNHLPMIVDRLSPEMVSLAAEAVTEIVSRENLLKFFDDVVAPVLDDKHMREQVARLITDKLRENSPQLAVELRSLVKDQANQSFSRRSMLQLAEWVKAVDWDDLTREIEVFLQSDDARRRVAAFLVNATPQVREVIRENKAIDDALMMIRNEGRTAARNHLNEYLQSNLRKVVDRLLDNDQLWLWVRDDGLHLLQQELISWLRSNGVDLLKEHLDVRGNVSEAIESMNSDEVNEAIQGVAAEQLGAIQVLGFILGAMGGCILLLAGQ